MLGNLLKRLTSLIGNNPETYRKAVHCRLRRVHDEVTQGEAEPLGSAPQTHGFGSRPWERLLFCWVLRWRRIGQASPLWRFILCKEESEGRHLILTFTFTMMRRFMRFVLKKWSFEILKLKVEMLEYPSAKSPKTVLLKLHHNWSHPHIKNCLFS